MNTVLHTPLGDLGMGQNARSMVVHPIPTTNSCLSTGKFASVCVHCHKVGEAFLPQSLAVNLKGHV